MAQRQSYYGRQEKANALFREAEEIINGELTNAEEAYGPDHPQVGIMLSYLAELYEYQGRTEEVRKLNERMDAMSKRGR